MTRVCEHPDTQGSGTSFTAGRDLRGISLAEVLKLCGQVSNILQQRSLRTWCSQAVTSSRNANGGYKRWKLAEPKLLCSKR